MINLKYFFYLFILFYLITEEVYFTFSIAIFISLFIRAIKISNNEFVFKEVVLLLYTLNYLLSPSISLLLGEKITAYNLKLTEYDYFTLAIPGFIFLYLGINCIKTNLFRPNFNKVKISSILNEKLLKNITVITVLATQIAPYLPSELSFLIYLFSLLQYVSSFSLFALNPQKNLFWPALTLLLLLYKSFLAGMYHDAIVWILFFGIFYTYIIKPSIPFILFGIVLISVFILFIQGIKNVYRNEVWSGQKVASISTVTEIGNSIATSDIILGENNLLGTLSRSNQAWIFASTVDNMDRNKNFQGLSNVYKYLEASLLPRFLAPDKIQSGNQDIFNAFSGHFINDGTSMGLGIFADGYIAYGAIGVYIFGFALGLIFALVFKLVEGWTLISPFYVLLIFPILNYAIRPDCELQTTINHLSKGILFYGLIVWYTKKKFSFVSETLAS
jgi:hypothetical protein